MSCGTKGCNNKVRGKKGDPGQSYYEYRGYASDNAGTNFSLTPSSSLQWTQLITRTTPASSLTVADFTGIWVKYIGDDGADGIFTNGDSWQFSTSLAGTPSVGYLSVDNANISAVTKIYINKTDSSTVNMSTWIAKTFASNAVTKSLVKVTQNPQGGWAIYAVTAGVLVGNVYNLDVTYLGSSSNSPFLNNDNVVFDFSICGNDGLDSGCFMIYADTDDVDSGSLPYPQPIPFGTQIIFKQFTVPGNTLETDGDYLEINLAALSNVNKDMWVMLICVGEPNLSFYQTSNAPGTVWEKIIVRRKALNQYSSSSESYMEFYSTNGVYKEVTMASDWTNNKTFSAVVYLPSDSLSAGEFIGKDLTVTVFKQ